jgi:hypothetical protein
MSGTYLKYELCANSTNAKPFQALVLLVTHTMIAGNDTHIVSICYHMLATRYTVAAVYICCSIAYDCEERLGRIASCKWTAAIPE